MKKIYLLLLVIFCFFGFNRSVYADLKEENKNTTCQGLIDAGKLSNEESFAESLFFNSSDYDATCVYYYDVKDGNTDKCSILKVAFNLDGTNKIDEAEVYNGTVAIDVIDDNWFMELVMGGEGDSEKERIKYFRDQVGGCPETVYFYGAWDSSSSKFDDQFSFYHPDGNSNRMTNFYVRDKEFKIPNLIINPFDPNAKVSSCSEILGDDGVSLLKTIKNLIMIFVPILLVVLGIIDISSAIFSGDENNMKKAQSKLVKRVIVAVVIFLIPVVLGFLLDIVNMIWPNIDADLCGIF